jgi:hypothetical protein
MVLKLFHTHETVPEIRIERNSEFDEETGVLYIYSTCVYILNTCAKSLITKALFVHTQGSVDYFNTTLCVFIKHNMIQTADIL